MPNAIIIQNFIDIICKLFRIFKIIEHCNRSNYFSFFTLKFIFEKLFGKKIWNVAELDDEVVFSYRSKDGEEGYPGNLQTKMFVKLTEANELIMRLEATTDQETIVNLTRHEYFNLNPQSGEGITKHALQINGGGILPKNENMPSRALF